MVVIRFKVVLIKWYVKVVVTIDMVGKGWVVVTTSVLVVVLEECLKVVIRVVSRVKEGGLFKEVVLTLERVFITGVIGGSDCKGEDE